MINNKSKIAILILLVTICFSFIVAGCQRNAGGADNAPSDETQTVYAFEEEEDIDFEGEDVSAVSTDIKADDKDSANVATVGTAEPAAGTNSAAPNAQQATSNNTAPTQASSNATPVVQGDNETQSGEGESEEPPAQDEPAPAPEPTTARFSRTINEKPGEWGSTQTK